MTKVPFQFARAHVHDAPQHLVTFAIDICSQNLIIVPIFTSQCQNFRKSEDSHIARALHVHSCILTPLVMHQRIALVELHQYAKFCVASSKFPESKGAYAYT